MRKLLLPLLAILLITACQKQIPTEQVLKEIAIEEFGSNSVTNIKVKVCHQNGVEIAIDEAALTAHIAHGDAVDKDNDGFYNIVSPCGDVADCDDNNSIIQGCIAIGANYQGGIVGYIFQPGDQGYVAGETHGLIAAPFDQGVAEWGCYGTGIATTSTAIGTGNQNTINIIAGCATPNIAARLCSELVLGGYSDWYLPSIDELHQIYQNIKDISVFLDDIGYWSSSEAGSVNFAYFVWIERPGSLDPDPNNWPVPNDKIFLSHVRAVRSF